MDRIEVSIRLRPIRFAFLVQPNIENKSNIQRIFQINTCLWGGMYNPIIPYFERVPSWWSRDERHYQKPQQIIDGYLSFFEPDFIIEAEKGLGKKLGLPEEVIVSIDDFHFDESVRGYRKIREQRVFREIRGLNVFGVYKELYQKEFKFVRRHKHSIILVQPKEDRFKLFASCVFGSFPQEKSLSYIEKGYRDAFDPKNITLDSSQLKEIYNSPYGSPLDIGCENIDVLKSDRADPTIFILDMTQPRDLIDFWNLRTYKRILLAIPVQWFESLSEFCKEFAIRNHRPLPGNSYGVMIHTTFLFSRSLTNEKIESIIPFLRVDKKNAIGIQNWYPRFWEKQSDLVWSPDRAVLTAGESKQEITIDDENGSFKFNNLSPNFIDRYTRSSCWANVIHLREVIDRNEIATIFPNSMRNPLFPNLSFDNRRILSNTEGLIAYQEHKNWHEYWNVSDGTSTFIKWLKTQDVKAEVSDAGKTLLQVMRSLKGFWGVSYISHPTTIKRLNSMACKLSKTIEEGEEQQQEQKEYPGRTVKYVDLKNEIHQLAEDDIASGPWRKKLLESLVKYDVIKLGLEVICDLCGHRNWYALDFLKYTLVCENCLKSFRFPQDNPSNRKVNWCYKVLGPFAKPDYAQGTYTSALALRFFNNLDRGFFSSLTWSTSLEIVLESGQKGEVDFLSWYQRRCIIENAYGVDLIFGESKSFANDSFKDIDLKNLQNLALKFPGSILVCATMKEELEKDEKERVSKLAFWGRENGPLGLTRAPVIVLTAKELFSQSVLGFHYIWEQAGGKRAQLIKPAYIREDNLRVLADLTQQMYLGLPSYYKWWEERWKQKKAKRRKKPMK